MSAAIGAVKAAGYAVAVAVDLVLAAVVRVLTAGGDAT